MTKEKLFFAACLMLLCAAALFAGSLAWYGSRNTGSSVAPAQQGVSAALQPGYASGVVVSTGTNSLVARLYSAGLDPQDLGVHTVKVDARTEIYGVGAHKDDKLFTKETASFIERQAATTTPLFAPDPYDHAPLSLADLAPNDKVAFVFYTGEDGKDSPLAMRIQFVEHGK